QKCAINDTPMKLHVRPAIIQTTWSDMEFKSGKEGPILPLAVATADLAALTGTCLDEIVRPRSFMGAISGRAPTGETPVLRDAYLSHPAICKLAEFFWAKDLTTLKDDDARECWYQDWLDYQAKHHLYASVLSPSQY